MTAWLCYWCLVNSTNIFSKVNIHFLLFNRAENAGCYSYIGMIGGQQTINYPQWCIDVYGSVQHEMLHALGFYHEESSPNRDDYVTIQPGNIKSGKNNYSIVIRVCKPNFIIWNKEIEKKNFSNNYPIIYKKNSSQKMSRFT